MSTQPNIYISPEQYLAIERQAGYRSEYFAGEMFAMTGASKRHNLITGNIGRVLGNQTLNRPCNVYSVDMRVKISGTVRYTYPNIVTTCGDEQFEDAESDTLLNPQLIIEVLSPLTEAKSLRRINAWRRSSSSYSSRKTRIASNISCVKASSVGIIPNTVPPKILSN